MWRQDWEEVERQQLGEIDNVERLIYQRGGTSLVPPPYPSIELCFSQMRLLVLFLDAKNEMDRMRFTYYSERLQTTVLDAQLDDLDTLARRRLASFGLLTLQVARNITSQERSLLRILHVLQSLVKLLPTEALTASHEYYSTFRYLLERDKDAADGSIKRAILSSSLAILSAKCHDMRKAYADFGTIFLCTPENSIDSSMLEEIGLVIAPELLALAIDDRLTNRSLSPPAVMSLTAEEGLWLLARIIFIYRHTLLVGSVVTVATEPELVKVLTRLLNLSADEIVLRINMREDDLMTDIDGAPGSVDGMKHTRPLPAFVRQQLSSLIQQRSITSLLSSMSQSSNLSRIDPRALAAYALTLLRVFPSQAPEIRMWLYTGSIQSRSISAIRYFWSAAKSTNVYQKILQNQRNVVTALTPPAVDKTQLNHILPSPKDVEDWEQEWGALLLFFELYSFVLKLMDDEEFLAWGDGTNGPDLSGVNKNIKAGALPMREISRMTIFLKNLAFCLYWNSSEVDDATQQKSANSLENTMISNPMPGISSAAGVPRQHLKEVVTGLLRMLHERDSRRKFLPDGHWLMTGQIEMSGFIPAVVAEEENRHEIQGDLSDESDEEVEEDEEASSNGWANPGAFRNFMPNSSQARLASFPGRNLQRLRREQEKTKKARQLESLVPRLEILRNLPFFIPFETRVKIFREFVYRDQMRRRDGFIDPDVWRMAVASRPTSSDGLQSASERLGRHQADIRRESVFEDAYRSFYDLGEGLKEPIQISFIDRFGTIEAGIDGGGVTKEFLTSVTSEAFAASDNLPVRMFVENEKRALYPNPGAYEEMRYRLKEIGVRERSEAYLTTIRETLRQYEFLGRVVGKCLYEGILIDIVFAGFFLLKWALTGGTNSASNESSYRASINDLRDLDEDLYRNLLKLKNYPGNVEEDFNLDFTITDEISVLDGEDTRKLVHLTRNLKPGGADEPVTNANRLAYISYVAQHRLARQPYQVTMAFLRGLSQIIQPMWLAMFNQNELQTLIGGDSNEIDIADLRSNTQYGGVYVIGNDGLEHPTINLFWRVLKEMDDKDRRKVLKFVTSTPRAPLLGFSHLQPRFSIRDSSDDQTRLPSTSTCVNLLKLPRYASAKTMKEKLLYAVNSGAGFDLS